LFQLCAEGNYVENSKESVKLYMSAILQAAP